MGETVLPEKAVKLLRKPVFGHVASLMPDGSPQVTPVWVDTDGVHVLINTSQDRVKAKNLRRDPRVALSVVDFTDPYMGSLQVRGRVVDVTTQGADQHIDFLARKYTGAERYQRRRPDEVRVVIKIKPEKLSGGILWGGKPPSAGRRHPLSR